MRALAALVELPLLGRQLGVEVRGDAGAQEGLGVLHQRRVQLPVEDGVVQRPGRRRQHPAARMGVRA
jgi:hypothetical protein